MGFFAKIKWGKSKSKARPRITLSIRHDRAFEIWLNEEGRDLLVQWLRTLDRENDHIHLDYVPGQETDNYTDVVLSVIPYRADDKCLEFGKILLRPDDDDRLYYPHVLADG